LCAGIGATSDRFGLTLWQFFSLSLDLMAVVGFDGRFKALTGAWSGLLGYSTDELLGRRYEEFVHPDDCDGTGRAISSLTDGQLMVTFENRFACRDGSYRWLAWMSMPTVDERLIYAVARDVTAERNRAQIERARTAVIAAAANWDQAVSGVLAAMSAELEWLRGEYWAMIDGVPQVARVWPDRPGTGVPAGQSIASEVLGDLVPVVVRSRAGALPPTQARQKRIKAHGAPPKAEPGLTLWAVSVHERTHGPRCDPQHHRGSTQDLNSLRPQRRCRATSLRITSKVSLSTT
jgi:PAS domain S-box-containing protein